MILRSFTFLTFLCLLTVLLVFNIVFYCLYFVMPRMGEDKIRYRYYAVLPEKQVLTLPVFNCLYVPRIEHILGMFRWNLAKLSQKLKIIQGRIKFR